jgi:predicted acylesterase/phospholipase RssA
MQTGGAINAISKITGRMLKPLTGRLTAKSEAPRAVSLVLSGGGARSFAQIGVIRAMEEAGINRDVTICKRYSASLPTWKIWWSRINPFAEPIKVPTVVDILMNTAMLDSQRQSDINRQLADVCLRPQVDEFAAFDFKSFDQIVEIGYQCARQRIAEGFAETKTTERLQPVPA